MQPVQQRLLQFGLLGGQPVRLIGKALLILAEPLRHQGHLGGKILHQLGKLLSLEGGEHAVHKILGGADEILFRGRPGGQRVFFSFVLFFHFAYTRRIPAAACSALYRVNRFLIRS